MQQMIDIPVSNYTGAASISIPLHVAGSKSIQLPVELSYATGGIKADQAPTAVGLGWVLNAGGMISCTGFQCHLYKATYWVIYR
ncbi:hypothetical protein [Chitinophaga sp. OAE865]|uniref:hypothetical protein n=1 Tax=Chitinophaga sp. OAE865 TaxID=2817898 RepID=UPI001AE6DE1C